MGNNLNKMQFTLENSPWTNSFKVSIETLSCYNCDFDQKVTYHLVDQRELRHFRYWYHHH